MSRFLRMLEPWADFQAGVKVRVLEPGEPIAGRCVDEFRADRLLADQLAEDLGEAPEAAPVKKKAKAKKKAAKKKATKKKR